MPYSIYIILEFSKPISDTSDSSSSTHLQKTVIHRIGPRVPPLADALHAMAVPLDVVDFYLRRGGCEAQDEEVLRMVRRMRWGQVRWFRRNRAALVKQ